MLDVFPELLAYHDLAPFILRLVLGLVIVNLGYLKLTSEKDRWVASFGALHMHTAARWVSFIGALEMLGGIMLMAGIYTQAVALLFSMVLIFEMILESIAETILIRNFTFYLLLFAIAFSLLFTGAGGFALDVPLR